MKKELLLGFTLGAVSLLAFSKEERMEAGRRANWHCEAKGCKRSFQDGWMIQIDHITPVAQGGRDDVKRNAQALCLYHHAEKTEADGDYAGARLIRAKMAATMGGRTDKWIQQSRPLRKGSPLLLFRK